MTAFLIRIETIDYLIRSRSTGSPNAFARRLGISERALYDTLDRMRFLGAPITYCKLNKTYYYTEKGGFDIRFKKVREA